MALLLWLGPVLVGISLLLAWGAAWSVRKPLLHLTRAAERLASGDLETPITSKGRDEIGKLGRAFESMRRSLSTSRDEIEAINADLEARVRQRTQELDRLNRELRERERIRQSLLRKVITAQEDERKRVARELHDEALQTVTALGLHLDTALADAPPGTPLKDDLVRARELTTRSLDELHRLMHDLRPALLDDMGLVAAIRWYAERRLAP
jgi:signal transduction histidine kinase